MFTIYKSPKRITSVNSAMFFNEMMAIVVKGSSIVVDMSDTAYLSSAALRSILIVAKTLKSKNMPKLKLINANTTVRDILEAGGFDFFVEID